jgi:hypothetical protein
MMFLLGSAGLDGKRELRMGMRDGKGEFEVLGKIALLSSIKVESIVINSPA